MMKRLLLFCTVFSILMSSSLLRAQKDAASLEGRVSDTSGAVIPKATVTVTNTDTNLAYHAQSDASGGWAISPVRIGTYRVQITAPGSRLLLRDLSHWTCNSASEWMWRSNLAR